MNKTKKKDNTYFKNYDLYSDKNPKDSVRINYKNVPDVKKTIRKLEKLYKNDSRPHKRISQITNVLVQRLRVINDKDPRYKLALRYFNFLKERTKLKNNKKRKNLKFKF